MHAALAQSSLSSSQRRVVSALLTRLQDGLAAALGPQIVGVYLYGSLVTGDFDFDISDIDLVVVLNEPLDHGRFKALHELHGQTVRAYPAWDDRLELAYISAEGLRSFRARSSTIGIISPGEPFHLLEAGADWLISWYALREIGIALQGPPIDTLIEPLSKRAWLEAVRGHICAYRESLASAPDKPYLAYIVLTVARGLYTLAHERDCSKLVASKWLADEHPQWSPLLERARRIRRDRHSDSLSLCQLRSRVECYLRAVLPTENRGS